MRKVDVNLQAKGKRLWQAIHYKDQFDRHRQIAQHISQLQRSSMLTFINEKLTPAASARIIFYTQQTAIQTSTPPGKMLDEQKDLFR